MAERMGMMEQWRRETVDPWFLEYGAYVARVKADQDFRDRYLRERNTRWARLRRSVALVAAGASAVAVVASACVELVHLL